MVAVVRGCVPGHFLANYVTESEEASSSEVAGLNVSSVYFRVEWLTAPGNSLPPLETATFAGRSDVSLTWPTFSMADVCTLRQSH